MPELPAAKAATSDAAAADPQAAERAARIAEAKARGAERRRQMLEDFKQRQARIEALNQAFRQHEARHEAKRLAEQQEEQRRLLNPAQTQPALDGDEQQVRDAVFFQGRAFVKQQRLRDAEAAYRDYVEKSRRTPSGVWMSSIFFSGVSAGLLENVPEEAKAHHWQWLEQQTLNWAREAPDSPLPRLLHADVLLDHAWNIRGNLYVAKTPKSVWKPFLATLEGGLKYLDHERAVASHAPEYYWLTLKLMRGSKHGGDPLAVLEQSERAFPGHYPSYFAMFITLLPKWDGSVEHIEAFAESAAQRTRKTEGDSMYARIYWYAAQTYYRSNLFDATDVRWDRMKQGFEDVLKRYPDEWNLQNYARFACDAQDRDKLIELLSKMKKPPIDEAWSNPQHFEKCSQMAGRLSL
ncbi:hypothetical protein [Lysobacter sp. CA199]|uniref:hypothetical protein n=1 Tax=Lysobacter sp. CA199 TaxID=3455608 RepID=UPI003F8D7560